MSPVITFRVTEEERAITEQAARQAGQDVSTYVREALELRRESPNMHQRLDLHGLALQSMERRLAALEEMAYGPR